MRILGTLGFVLIVGILSPTVAQVFLDPNRPSSHLRFLGFANITAEEIEDFDRQLCETNGGPTAHDEHKKSTELFNHCDSLVHNEVYKELIGATNESITHGYYVAYCKRIPNFKSCMKNFTDSVKTCLDTSKHETADIMYNVYGAMLDFMCNDLGSHVEEYTTDSFNDCMSSTMPAFGDCANQTVVKYVQKIVANGASIGGIGSLHLLVPDVPKCRAIEKFEQCAIDALKNCTTQTPADAAASLFSVVNKQLTCDKLLKSDASPARIINIVLISALVAMSVKFVF